MSKKTKGRSAGCGEEFSPWHGTDGRFTNPDEEKSGSWSCSEKGQTSRRGRSKRWTKVPCGRKARAQGNNVRCHDGKVMNSEVMKRIRELVEEELMALKHDDQEEALTGWHTVHVPTLVREFERSIRTETDGLIDEADCGACIRNYLKSLNAAIKASKGDMDTN